MIVSEFIEWLKTQDQQAVVTVLQRNVGQYGYDGDGFSEVVFDPTPYMGTFTYTDIRHLRKDDGTPFRDPHTLFLGET